MSKIVEKVVFVNITEAALMLGISRKHAYSLVRRGLLTPWRSPIYHARGPVKIPVEEVQKLQWLLLRATNEQRGRAFAALDEGASPYDLALPGPAIPARR